MFGFSLLILLLSNIIIHSSAFSPRISALYRRSSNVVVAAANTEVEDMRGSREGGSDRDLTDYKLWITFTGFEVKDMHFGIEFNSQFQAEYSRGLASREPGFWRCVKYEDGKESIEITHPLLPEYLYFFDIWEASILWRGTLDMDSGVVVDGEVITNKKRFGLFPYTEVLATWSARVLSPDEQLPDVPVPQLKDQTFLMPKDFTGPGDMRRYPEIFDRDYVDYMFQVEDATVRGEEPPPRPQETFVPGASAAKGSEEVVKKVGFDSQSSSKRNKQDQVGGKLKKKRR